MDLLVGRDRDASGDELSRCRGFTHGACDVVLLTDHGFPASLLASAVGELGGRDHLLVKLSRLGVGRDDLALVPEPELGSGVDGACECDQRCNGLHGSSGPK